MGHKAWHGSAYMYQCIHYILLRHHYIHSLYPCMSAFKTLPRSYGTDLLTFACTLRHNQTNHSYLHDCMFTLPWWTVCTSVTVCKTSTNHPVLYVTASCLGLCHTHEYNNSVDLASSVECTQIKYYFSS